MAITRQIQTPLRYAKVKKRIVIPHGDSVAIAGTFNSVTCGASGTGVLYDRWFFRAYASSGSPASQRNVSQWNFTLPEDYVSGSDIDISFCFTSTNATGTMNWGVGLTKLTAGGLLGDEADTQYQTYAEAVGGTATFDSELSATNSYTGTGIEPGEPMSIIIYRDDTVDGLGADTYIQQVYVEYESYSYPADDGVDKYKMTPTKHKNVTKTHIFPLFQITNDAGTFNGIVASASVLSQDQYRIIGWRGDQTTDEVIQGTWRMPEDYQDGTDIDIEIKFYGEGTSSGNIVMGVGLCSDTMGNTYGDEADTTYVQNTVAFNGTGNDEQIETFSFSPTGLIAGDPICIIVYRGGGEAADTYVSDINITGVGIKYKGDYHGNNI